MEARIETDVYSPQDAARVCGCSTPTVKRIADELRLPLLRTIGGIRLFTTAQVERIKAERDRRERER